MNEENVLEHLVAAEKRAQEAYEKICAIEALGWRVDLVLKSTSLEAWATARALRELWCDRALEAPVPTKNPTRRGM